MARSATRTKRYKDKDFLAWAELQPCMITGKMGAGYTCITSPVRNGSFTFTAPARHWQITLHHVKRCPGGTREDRRVVPLVDYLHMLTHEIPGQPCVERGKQVFEEFWGVDLEKEILRLNREYELEQALGNMFKNDAVSVPRSKSK